MTAAAAAPASSRRAWVLCCRPPAADDIRRQLALLPSTLDLELEAGYLANIGYTLSFE